MATIIAGRFAQQHEVEEMVAHLAEQGFAHDKISTFYLNPRGRHATYPIGGDEDKSPGAEKTDVGVATGAAAGAAVGVAVSPLLGPVGPIAGGGLGGYLGGLVGGLSTLKERGDTGDGEDPDNALPIRHSGMFVAVEVADDAAQDLAVQALASCGALDIEMAEGHINDADWADFDPSLAPRFCTHPNTPTRRSSPYASI